jgi:hypothetical protein
MLRTIMILGGAALPLLLTGCAKTCEDIAEEMAELGLQAAQDPNAGEDVFERLEELQDQMLEMECFAP